MCVICSQKRNCIEANCENDLSSLWREYNDSRSPAFGPLVPPPLPPTQLQQLLSSRFFFQFFSLYVRDNKNFFHPKSKLHAMQYVGTHDILFSPFIKTLLLFLLAYVRETTCKIRRSTDHSTNTEHFNAGRSNFFNITKTKIFDVAKLSISIPLKLIFECRKI